MLAYCPCIGGLHALTHLKVVVFVCVCCEQVFGTLDVIGQL